MSQPTQENEGKTYKLAPEGFERVHRLLVGWTVGLMPVVLLAGLFVATRRTNLPSDGFPWPVIAAGAICIAAMVFGMLRSLRQQRQAWLDFELRVFDNRILRRTSNYPDIQILRHEITALRNLPKGLKVETADKNRWLFIDRSLIGFEELKGQLDTWAPIQQAKPGASGLIHSTVASLATVAAFVAVFLTDNRLVVVPVGSLLLSGLLFSLVQVIRSPHLDSRTKRRMWFVVLPMLAIGARVVSVLFN